MRIVRYQRTPGRLSALHDLETCARIRNLLLVISGWRRARIKQAFNYRDDAREERETGNDESSREPYDAERVYR